MKAERVIGWLTKSVARFKGGERWNSGELYDRDTNTICALGGLYGITRASQDKYHSEDHSEIRSECTRCQSLVALAMAIDEKQVKGSIEDAVEMEWGLQTNELEDIVVDMNDTSDYKTVKGYFDKAVENLEGGHVFDVADAMGQAVAARRAEDEEIEKAEEQEEWRPAAKDMVEFPSG